MVQPKNCGNVFGETPNTAGEGEMEQKKAGPQNGLPALPKLRSGE
jgi:hypothetical protein